MQALLKDPFQKLFAKTAPLLNIPYEVQLKMKERRCINSLKMFASILRKSNYCPPEFLEDLSKYQGVPCKIEPIKRSLNEEGYRNKVAASVGFDINGKISVGHILQIKNRSIVISQFPHKMNTPRQLNIVKIFEQFVRENSQFIPNKNTLLRYWSGIMVRSNRKEESMIHINFSGQDKSEEEIDKAKKELTERYLPMLAKDNINVQSLYWQYNHHEMSVPDNIYPSELLFGTKYITETLCNKIFYIAPRSFFQINTDVAEILYKTTKELITDSVNGSNRKRLILDLCCGTGTIGIILSDIAHKVISIDRVVDSVEAAKYNAVANNITNIEHVCQDVEQFLVDFIKKGDFLSYDDIIAVVNPSRSGLTTRFCEKLRQCRPLSMVLYLSCRFEGQPSQNLYHLCKISKSRNHGKSFKLTNVVPLDPFPHTKYVELILKLIR